MIDIYTCAGQLPDDWDLLAGSNGALKKNSLILLEQVNPCRQCYVVFKQDEIYGILVHYELQIDIFSYSRLNLKLPVRIVGIPCSVAEPGYQIRSLGTHEAAAYLNSLKGATLVLNAREDMDFTGFHKGFTLPNCVMDLPWMTFDAYLLDLRSHYRYRYQKALRKAANLTIEVLNNRLGDIGADGKTKTAEGAFKASAHFDHRHYKLYEQVYRRSDYKLEKLPMEFFQQSPAIIAAFDLGKEPVAFAQYYIEDQRLVFLFGGLDYSLNKKYDLYQNMLLYLIRTAIENHCTCMSLGQTAEEVKCRLGAVPEIKYLYLHHSNRLINWMAGRFKSLFSYKTPEIRLNVLNEKKENKPC